VVNKEVPLVVFDMSSLTIWKNDTSYSLKTQSGGIIASVDISEVESYTERDIVFACYDKSLNSVWIHDNQMCVIGLYNPVTAEVAIGSVPETRVYKSSKPVKIPSLGVRGSLTKDSIFINGSKVFALVTDSDTFIKAVRTSLNATK